MIKHRVIKPNLSLVWSISLHLFLLIGLAACGLTTTTATKTLPGEIGIGPTAEQPQPSPAHTPFPTEQEPSPLLRQWADDAIDGERSEQARHALKEPDAENCELTPWESVWIYPSEFYPNAADYLQLFYAEPVHPTQVNIHFAYSFSAIVNISLIDIAGNPHEIYSGTPSHLNECPSLLTIDTTDVNDPVYAVRFDLDTLDPDEEGNLTAIDAVELVGLPLTTPIATPEPTPYLTVSDLGFNASQVQEGYVYFEIRDLNTNETLTTTECNAFSYNLTDTERLIRFFSCADSTEIWVYLPLSLEIGDLPLNTYPTVPTARLFFEQRFIPAMEGSLYLDQLDEKTITGVLEFAGFDPENNGAYYGTFAVFNQVPIDEKSAQRTGDMIAQWAKDAASSSELSPQDHGALQALGASDTWENCEGAVTAWQPAPSDSEPWIELYFEAAVIPETLNILLTGFPDSVSAVNLLSATDFFPLDLANARILDGCPTTLTFNPVGEVGMDIIGVQIMFEEGNDDFQLGLDAVQLIGILTE